MKKVLQVVGKMNVGGAEILLMNVYRNIDRSKVQFDFLTFYDAGETGFFDDEIRQLGGRIVNIEKPSVLRYARSVEQAAAVFRAQTYDAVHTHIGSNALFALQAARRLKVPIRIAHSHNVKATTESAAVSACNAILDRLADRCYTKCCACSRAAGEYRFSGKNMATRYTFVPNAVDFSPFLQDYDRSALRKSLDIGDGRLCLLQVGNFGPQKNQAFSVALLRELLAQGTDCVLVFAGREGEYGAGLKQDAARLGDHVRFLGQRTDIPQLMSAADILLMPSAWEGLGIVLLEAQAAGLPCLVSENIQPEAVMDEALVRKCRLDRIPAWCEGVRALAGLPRRSVADRARMIAVSPFRLEETVACFSRLYEL